MNIKVDENAWLRSLELNDLVQYRPLHHQPELEELLVGWNFPLNKAEQEKWYLSQPMKSNTQRFSFFVQDNWAGFAGLWGIDWKDRYAEIGLALAPGNQGHGYGKKIILAISRFAFDTLNLNRIETEILGYNEASNRAFQRCGYELEGVQKKKVFKRGAYQDLNLLAILRENYAPDA